MASLAPSGYQTFFCRAVIVAVLLLFTGRAAVAGSPYQPTARERAWLEQCLAQHEAAGPIKTLAACVERITGACLGLEDSLKLPAVSGRNSHPDSCAPVEERLWDVYLSEAYHKLMTMLDAAAQGKVRKAQQVWLAYRDAACGVYDFQPASLGIANAASCHLDETARRALELRALLGDAAQPQAGAFTEAVVQALGLPGRKGQADYLHDGRITTSELDLYMRERVKTLTDGTQSPVMIRPNTMPDFPFALAR